MKGRGKKEVTYIQLSTLILELIREQIDFLDSSIPVLRAVHLGRLLRSKLGLREQVQAEKFL